MKNLEMSFVMIPQTGRIEWPCEGPREDPAIGDCPSLEPNIAKEKSEDD